MGLVDQRSKQKQRRRMSNGVYVAMNNLTTTLNRIWHRQVVLAEDIARYNRPPLSDREDARDQFVRDVYEAFNKAGWREQ